MRKLTETYSNLLGEALLDEARVEFSDLGGELAVTTTHDKVVLFNTEGLTPESTSEEIQANILGQIMFSDEDDNDTNSVISVAAKKGYGLIMYELGMQYIYTNDLVSSRDGDTRAGAFRLYSYYYKGLNPRVQVQKLNPDDPDYLKCIDDADDDSGVKCTEENPNQPQDSEIMQLYNSKLSMKPSELPQLKDRGDIFLNNMQSTMYKFAINSAASDFFKAKYVADLEKD